MAGGGPPAVPASVQTLMRLLARNSHGSLELVDQLVSFSFVVQPSPT